MVVVVNGQDRFHLERNPGRGGAWCLYPLLDGKRGPSIDSNDYRSDLLERIECQYLDCTGKFLEGMATAQSWLDSGFSENSDGPVNRHEEFFNGFIFRMAEERSRRRQAPA